MIVSECEDRNKDSEAKGQRNTMTLNGQLTMDLLKGARNNKCPYSRVRE
jgi:hypothetical protein